MFKINLVPEIQENKNKLARINSTVTLVAIVCGGVTAAALIILGGLWAANKASISGNEKKITSLNANLLQYKELEENVLSLESGLAGAKAIIDGSNSWTLLLPQIERATPADVKYTKLALEENTIDAALRGRDVNSLARFVESFKSYEIYVLSGSGTSGETVKVTIDDQTPTEIRVRTSGQWVYPISFDPSVTHSVKVTGKNKNGDEETLAAGNYDPTSKELKVETGSISIQKKKLFSNVEVSEYQRDGDAITFQALINFDEAILW